MATAAGAQVSVEDNCPSAYRAALASAFTLFNAGRILAYLPTIWIILRNQDSSQHSLWTWSVLLGANATMAIWQWESARRRCDPVVLANTGNALMCLAIVAVITWTRL